MYRIGRIYAQGTFVEKNDALALQWFKKAEQKGNHHYLYLAALLYGKSS